MTVPNNTRMSFSGASSRIYLASLFNDDFFFDQKTRVFKHNIVGTLTKGSTFGELGIMRSVPRAATIISNTECVLALINGDIYRALLKQGQQEEIERKNNFFKKHLLGDLEYNNLLKIAYYFQEKKARKGEILYYEGQPISQVILIQEGEINLQKQLVVDTLDLDKINQDPICKKISKYRAREKFGFENYKFWIQTLAVIGPSEFLGGFEILQPKFRSQFTAQVASDEIKYWSCSVQHFQRLIATFPFFWKELKTKIINHQENRMAHINSIIKSKQIREQIKNGVSKRNIDVKREAVTGALGTGFIKNIPSKITNRMKRIQLFNSEAKPLDLVEKKADHIVNQIEGASISPPKHPTTENKILAKKVKLKRREEENRRLMSRVTFDKKLERIASCLSRMPRENSVISREDLVEIIIHKPKDLEVSSIKIQRARNSSAGKMGKASKAINSTADNTIAMSNGEGSLVKIKRPHSNSCIDIISSNSHILRPNTAFKNDSKLFEYSGMHRRIKSSLDNARRSSILDNDHNYINTNHFQGKRCGINSRDTGNTLSTNLIMNPVGVKIRKVLMESFKSRFTNSKQSIQPKIKGSYKLTVEDVCRRDYFEKRRISNTAKFNRRVANMTRARTSIRPRHGGSLG